MSELMDLDEAFSDRGIDMLSVTADHLEAGTDPMEIAAAFRRERKRLDDFAKGKGDYWDGSSSEVVKKTTAPEIERIKDWLESAPAFKANLPIYRMDSKGAFVPAGTESTVVWHKTAMLAEFDSMFGAIK